MQFRRRLQQRATIELVPMIDVVFQLVVFFMLTSTFVMTPGIALELPRSSSTEQVAMDRLVVSIAGPEEIYLNQDKYTLDELKTALGEVAEARSTSGGGARSVVLEGDRSISYDLMVEVLDVLRSNGFRAVNLKTVREEQDSANAGR
jgi:biopolymer transport protein ExbD